MYETREASKKSPNMTENKVMNRENHTENTEQNKWKRRNNAQIGDRRWKNMTNRQKSSETGIINAAEIGNETNKTDIC